MRIGEISSPELGQAQGLEGFYILSFGVKSVGCWFHLLGQLKYSFGWSQMVGDLLRSGLPLVCLERLMVFL